MLLFEHENKEDEVLKLLLICNDHWKLKFSPMSVGSMQILWSFNFSRDTDNELYQAITCTDRLCKNKNW